MTRSFARRIGVLDVVVVVVPVAVAVAVVIPAPAAAAAAVEVGDCEEAGLPGLSASSALSTLSSSRGGKELELVVWASARLAARKWERRGSRVDGLAVVVEK